MAIINRVVFFGLIVFGGIMYLSLLVYFVFPSIYIYIQLPQWLTGASVILAYFFGVFAILALFCVLLFSIMRRQLSIIKPLYVVNGLLAFVGFGFPLLLMIIDELQL